MTSYIYLDNNATTALDPRVATAMRLELPLNPSSPHRYGQRAKQLLLEATRRVAAHLSFKPEEVLFTSGATESINMVLRGLLSKGDHLVTSAFEHACLYNTAKAIEPQGVAISFLAHPRGAISPEEVKAALLPETKLIALLGANNETGVLTDIDGVAALAASRGIPLLVDGVMLLGKHTLSLPAGVTFAAFSGHKIHGPKGVGVLAMRRPCAPLLTGGPQQLGRRAGTENLEAILGFTAALSLLSEGERRQMALLRDRLEAGLRILFPELLVHGGDGPRICNTSNVAFPGVDGESLLIELDLQGVGVSHGSACMSGAREVSRILLNMGIPRKIAQSSLRFSLSRQTTQEEIDRTLSLLEEILRRLS